MKALIDGLQTQVNELPPVDAMTDLIDADSAGKPVGLTPPSLTVSNPPTQAQVQAIVNYLNALHPLLTRT